ncbi:MAG: hypothetical protein ACXW0H_05715 [Methylobacter sp.]
MTIEYVLEEFQGAKIQIDRLAGRGNHFVSKPHFVTLHLLRLVIRVLANWPFVSYFSKLR